MNMTRIVHQCERALSICGAGRFPSSSIDSLYMNTLSRQLHEAFFPAIPSVRAKMSRQGHRAKCSSGRRRIVSTQSTVTVFSASRLGIGTGRRRDCWKSQAVTLHCWNTVVRHAAPFGSRVTRVAASRKANALVKHVQKNTRSTTQSLSVIWPKTEVLSIMLHAKVKMRYHKREQRNEENQDRPYAATESLFFFFFFFSPSSPSIASADRFLLGAASPSAAFFAFAYKSVAFP